MQIHYVDVSARISKWIVQLQEFDYTVMVEESTWAALADILTHQFREKEYIIVGIDYMTRWAEASPTSRRITAKDVAKFVFENIYCRFGTPLEIISDRGPGFRGELVKELMTKLGIKQRHSSPYYPQCNGLVEKVNGMICQIITKHVGEKAQTCTLMQHYGRIALHLNHP